jgi:delta 1-pyrroline-5-carboxylate dehydrogenase
MYVCVCEQTAKRVMANASQSCRMAISRLRTLTEQKSVVDSVVGMLNTTLSECITGCEQRTGIYASAPIKGMRMCMRADALVGVD